MTSKRTGNWLALVVFGVLALAVILVVREIVNGGSLGPSSSGPAGQATSGSAPDQNRAPLPLRAPFEIGAYYYPSGWMGDGEEGRRYIEYDPNSRENPRSGDSDSLAIKVTYKPGPRSWAGIYWQHPDGNWGDFPGKNIVGAKRVTFWAAGGEGGEVVEFKVGGIRDGKKRYADSLEVSLGRMRLTRSWQKYEIDLTNQDLSTVIGAFAWLASGTANPNRLTFYLDDIRYE